VIVNKFSGSLPPQKCVGWELNVQLLIQRPNHYATEPIEMVSDIKSDYFN